MNEVEIKIILTADGRLKESVKGQSDLVIDVLLRTLASVMMKCKKQEFTNNDIAKFTAGLLESELERLECEKKGGTDYEKERS